MPVSPRLGSRLYAIADAECLGTDPDRFADRAAAIVSGGVRILQLRLKPTDSKVASDDLLRSEIIERTLTALDRRGLADEVQLWLDDRADLAAYFPGAFAGVHVGQDDLTPAAVRSVFGSGEAPLVGLSCHDPEQVRGADADIYVDWVAIGPVFSTGSKPDPDPIVGLDGILSARKATSKPLVAIGGLNAERILAVLEAGADAAVVLSALVAGGREPAAIETTARRLVRVAGDTGPVD
jgi:thiamine-phosphate pyrophosphorylase